MPKLICLAVASMLLAGLTATQAQEKMQWRDSKGRNVIIARPNNYAQCRANNRKQLHFSDAESHAWCSSPDRRWNRK
jgi:hypothetical protein